MINRLIKDVDFCRGEVSRTDSSLEEEVKLSESASCRLRYPVVGVDDAKKTAASPELISLLVFASVLE